MSFPPSNKRTKDRHNDRPRQTGGETWAEAQRDFQQTELTDRSGALSDELTKKILGLNPHVVIKSNNFKIGNDFEETLKQKYKDINVS